MLGNQVIFKSLSSAKDQATWKEGVGDGLDSNGCSGKEEMEAQVTPRVRRLKMVSSGERRMHERSRARGGREGGSNDCEERLVGA